MTTEDRKELGKYVEDCNMVVALRRKENNWSGKMSVDFQQETRPRIAEGVSLMVKNCLDYILQLKSEAESEEERKAIDWAFKESLKNELENND